MTKKRKFTKKDVRVVQDALRVMINEWEPIGVPTPEDEYDCLVDHLVSVLFNGGNEADVTSKIRTELRDHFGLRDIPEKEIGRMGEQIWGWWQADRQAVGR